MGNPQTNKQKEDGRNLEAAIKMKEYETVYRRAEKLV